MIFIIMSKRAYGFANVFRRESCSQITVEAGLFQRPASLLFEFPAIGDAAVEALACEDARFAFSDVEPGAMFRCVVPLEPFCDPAASAGSNAS